jgi:ADP-heptose:LPS heptosyltransferase/predicted SAM-dependent methyltransferase
MVWRANDPQGNESKKIVWEVARYLRGRGLDVGAGDFKILPHAISVDNMNHAQFGFNVRPDVWSEADDLSMFASCSMDFVYSSHTLEHIHDTAKALAEWWRVVKQGGYLVLYLPHKDFYPNIGQPGANPDHKHDFLPEDVISKMPQKGWDLIVCQERNNDSEYSFLLVFEKIPSSKTIRSCNNPKPEKTACVVRYGAFGDMIQASSVFAGLKQQGYHVTVMTSPPGSDVITHDPNVDEIILFDKDQVPNGNLHDFWSWQSKNYTKFVNLSESVEGTFLALPGRIQHTWNPETRHKMMNRNYLEHQHDVAGLEHKPQVKFYATPEEMEWARNTRARMGRGPIIMYSLSGSSVHKTWQGMDTIIASIMLHFPTSTVVLVGGPEGVILEQGWEKEPRVVRTSGKWTIRQTLAFIAKCDLMIGPETGVMNAAACEKIPKVVFLSHSSHENLTRDWALAYPMFSGQSRCPKRPHGVSACHMLHYGWEHCYKDETTHTALCQADITPEQVWGCVAMLLERATMKETA